MVDKYSRKTFVYEALVDIDARTITIPELNIHDQVVKDAWLIIHETELARQELNFIMGEYGLYPSIEQLKPVYPPSKRREDIEIVKVGHSTWTVRCVCDIWLHREIFEYIDNYKKLEDCRNRGEL